MIILLQTAQHRLQATRLRRLPAQEPRAQAGLLSKVLRRTRRAPEPYRWARCPHYKKILSTEVQ